MRICFFFERDGARPTEPHPDRSHGIDVPGGSLSFFLEISIMLFLCSLRIAASFSRSELSVQFR